MPCGSPVVVALALPLALLVLSPAVVSGAPVVGVSLVGPELLVPGSTPVGFCVVEEAEPPALIRSALAFARGD